MTLALLTAWNSSFGGQIPVAHLLRESLPDRWVRFHSLTGSRRYPESERDYEAILNRHHQVLQSLVGSKRRVVLLTTGYSETAIPIRSPSCEMFDPYAVAWRSVPMHKTCNEYAAPNYWHVFASEWQWQPGVFDSILRLVADDQLSNVMMVDPDCEWLLHPYDGGMDVIAKTEAQRDHIKAAFCQWLSPRLDRL